MEFSEFAFRIVLLFLPGVVSFLIIDKLTAHRQFKPHAIAIYSLLLGFYCYVTFAVLAEGFQRAANSRTRVSFIEALTDSKSRLDLFEIVLVAMLAVPIGFLVAFAINHSWLHRAAQVLHVSRKFGDLDVWSFIMNSDIQPWVVVRDREHDIMYEGWVAAFSDTSESHELFLRDVRVYRNSSGDMLYETPALYLPRKRDEITVEFGAAGRSQEEGDRGK